MPPKDQRVNERWWWHLTKGGMNEWINEKKTLWVYMDSTWTKADLEGQASSSFTTIFPTLKLMQDFHVMWVSKKLHKAAKVFNRKIYICIYINIAMPRYKTTD